MKEKLENKYEINALNELQHYLRVVFIMNNIKYIVIISHSKYIKEILKHFNVKECISTSTSLKTNLKILKPSKEDFRQIKDKISSNFGSNIL